MTTLLNWLKLSPPTWATQAIDNWRSRFINSESLGNMTLFATEAIHESDTTIDMRHVIGQCDHYAGQTWLDAAINPREVPSRMSRCFSEYEANPSYYFSGAVDNGMSFTSLNGEDWYSCDSGNHRTVVAKFACENISQTTGNYPLVTSVRKHRYFVDHEAWELFRRLKDETNIEVSIKQKTTREHQEQSKRTVQYESTFTVTESQAYLSEKTQNLSLKEFVLYAKHRLLQDT